MISENCMMSNRIMGLLELESATLQWRHGRKGCLDAEDRANELKREVHEFTANMWKEASFAFQEHLLKPI